MDAHLMNVGEAGNAKYQWYRSGKQFGINEFVKVKSIKTKWSPNGRREYGSDTTGTQMRWW
jgi:hypothetical protein